VIGNKTSLRGSKEAEGKKEILLKDKQRTAQSAEDLFKIEINQEKGVMENKTSFIGSREAEEKKEILIKDKRRTAQSVEDLFKTEKEQVKDLQSLQN